MRFCVTQDADHSRAQVGQLQSLAHQDLAGSELQTVVGISDPELFTSHLSHAVTFLKSLRRSSMRNSLRAPTSRRSGIESSDPPGAAISTRAAAAACRAAFDRAVLSTELVHSPITRRATLGTSCFARPASSAATRCCSAPPNRRSRNTPRHLLGKRAVRRERAVHFVKDVVADPPRRAVGHALRHHARQRLADRPAHVPRHRVVGGPLESRVSSRIEARRLEMPWPVFRGP